MTSSDAVVATHAPAPATAAPACSSASLDRYLLIIYTVLAVIYLMLPVALIILFSFNNPAGKANIVVAGVHARVLAEPARRRRACRRRSA